MPRRVRVESCGFHHVYNRGVAKNPIFLDDFDKEKFLKILSEIARNYRLNIHAFCLMDNHYHLLVENQRENLSSAIRQINSSYAMYFNKRYERVGHLWQDRYKSWFILDSNHLFILFRYIEQNPIKAGMTQRVGEYKYASSYCFLKDAIPRFLQNSFVLREFNTVELFKTLEMKLNKEEIKSLEKLKTKRFKQEANKVVEVIQTPLDDIFFSTCSKEERNKAILKAFEEGHSKSQIARKIGLSVAGVSKIIKKLKV